MCSLPSAHCKNFKAFSTEESAGVIDYWTETDVATVTGSCVAVRRVTSAAAEATTAEDAVAEDAVADAMDEGAGAVE